MSAATRKAKKLRTKPPRSRPQSVSTISQLPVNDSEVFDLNAGEKSDEQTIVGVWNKRYAEPSSLEIRSGAELGQEPSADDLALRDPDGNLDVDLAELSLGQRLSALSANDEILDSSQSEDEENRPPKNNAKTEAGEGVVPANSLTRTLIQALHSSDSHLLETCLAHSKPLLIRNTIRKLPPQLAVPLLTACVERLGRGGRGENMKGGGGGASSQRGTALITWIKTVLTIHSGHLMTIPDLVARLSGLHATLTSRLALQASLLSLSGRLDMVLSQIELRSSSAPAQVTASARTKQSRPGNQFVKRYVEGESDQEDEMDVEVENDDGDGSVEDIEFGKGQNESEEEEEEDDGSDESGDNEDDDGPMPNGFIDDEAEQFDDESDDVSE